MMTINQPKGSPWIIAELEEIRIRNRNGDNPNLQRDRMIFDFESGLIRVETSKDSTIT